MKSKLILFAAFFIFLVAFTSSTKNVETKGDTFEKTKISLKGAWERTSYYNYGQDGKITDSFVASAESRHIKIFTESKVMWCRNTIADSTEWFGYGSYKLNDGLLTETLEYGSKEMSKYITLNPNFVFKYTLKKNKYSQIQIDEDGHPVFAENYIRIE